MKKKIYLTTLLESKSNLNFVTNGEVKFWNLVVESTSKWNSSFRIVKSKWNFFIFSEVGFLKKIELTTNNLVWEQSFHSAFIIIIIIIIIIICNTQFWDLLKTNKCRIIWNNNFTNDLLKTELFVNKWIILTDYWKFYKYQVQAYCPRWK